MDFFWVLGLVTLSNSISAPKDRLLEIVGIQNIFFLRKLKNILKSMTSQIMKRQSPSLLLRNHTTVLKANLIYIKGWKYFSKDNPLIINKTIFLSEGFPSDQPISVRPLIDVNSNPDESLINNVLESFLIT